MASDAEAEHLLLRTLRVVRALTDVARPIILTAFNKDSCIASTRIGIDALEYFGVKAVPIPMMMALLNAEAAALMGDGMSLAELMEVTRKYRIDEVGGPWTLGVGSGDGPGWAGHLMIGVPQALVVVDLAADQAARPHKNIHITEPMLLPVTDIEWWRGGKDAPLAMFEGEDGTHILLDRNGSQDPEGYKTSPNWRRSAGGSKRTFKDVTGQIIRAMKQELENS